MPGRISRRSTWVLVVLGAVVLAIFLPPYLNVNRFRSQAATSIGSALGRTVTVSNIELQLMPRPGLILSGFVVADDPSFGPEPMLRADKVTAYIRLSSLWRGRLEIGTLSLENPSLNLVRRDDSHWNLEELVGRTSQVRPAPTAETRPEYRTRFPYVEATGGRINFKLGQVKKAFAFGDADFAFWLESENEWRMRLEARPVRADVPVGDTGVFRMEGQFQRAPNLRETPVNLKATFAKGQLGQLTALIYGRDRGWRGSIASTATLAGTPSSLAVTLDASADDFRRFDIVLGEALRLSVHCNATYSSIDDSARGIQCQSPVKAGTLQLRGDVIGFQAQAFDLGVTAEQIPLDRLVALARHTKKDLPEDLTATGSADAVFTVRRSPGEAPVWSGGGRTTRFTLLSKALKPELELGPLEYAIVEAPRGSAAKPHRRAKAVTLAAGESSLRVIIKPFALPLGWPSPAVAKAFFDLNQYRIDLAGAAELTRLLNIGRSMGIGAPAIGAAGPAQVDFNIAGTWAGFALPVATGTMQFHDSIIELPGVFGPLHVGSAVMSLAQQSAVITSFAASFTDGPSITGSADFPLRCSDRASCVLQFDLHSPEVNLSQINQLLNPATQSRPWYRLLASSQENPNALLQFLGKGRIAIAHFTMANLVTSNFTSTVEFNNGAVSLKDLSADLLGGHHSGNWDIDFTAQPPKYFGSGSVSKIAMVQLAILMHDPWANGILSGQYTLGLVGSNPDALRDSASGSATFKWTTGSLRHMTLAGQGTPLSFADFEGNVTLQKKTLSCQGCTLKTNGATYTVSGSSGFDRSLDVKLERASGPSYSVSGPLESPRVEPLATTPAQAKLQ
jgi:hypothetical protein